jgi:putative ABC transport system ATP-binding protein
MNRTDAQPVFLIDRLSRSFRAPDGLIHVLQSLTCRIDGGITAILGNSGCGKTTLLNLLAGLDKPNAGEVWLSGLRVPYEDEDAMLRHRRRVACIWQANNLIGHLTCLDNAALPLICQGVARREARETAAHWLTRIGLHDKLDWHPHRLSGGQQQRVGIARGFASLSAVILADEPTGNLDEKTSHQVMKAFWEQARETDTPTLLVTHNRPLAEQYCDRILRLSDGGIEDVSLTVAGEGSEPHHAGLWPVDCDLSLALAWPGNGT